MLYLLQLVQALRYDIEETSPELSLSDEMPLSGFFTDEMWHPGMVTMVPLELLLSVKSNNRMKDSMSI